MTDFEQAFLMACRTVFPNSVQQGCLFLMSQCIWRQIQQTAELQALYSSDAELALHLWQSASLAVIPSADVITVFGELVDLEFFTTNLNELRDLVNYFEDTWIGRPARRGGRSAAIYPIELWNVYEQTIYCQPKTINSVEGWQRGVSRLLGSYHLSIWKFINGFQQEQSLNELRIEQFLSEQAIRRGRKVQCIKMLQCISKQSRIMITGLTSIICVA
jgi:hypothetical protein